MRMGPGMQGCANPGEQWLNGAGVPRIADGLRPSGIIEHIAIGFDCHVGIDQRGTTEPRRHPGADLRAEPEIVKAERVLGAAKRLSASNKIVREVTGKPLAPPLEHADGGFDAGPLRGYQTGCRDRPAVAGADDNHVIASGKPVIPVVGQWSSLYGIHVATDLPRLLMIYRGRVRCQRAISRSGRCGRCRILRGSPPTDRPLRR